MNSLIENLNIWGSRLENIASGMFIQSSVLIMLLFALDLIIQRTVRAGFRYGLWMLVLIKLLLPPSLALPTGLAYWLPVKKIVNAPTVTLPRVVIRYGVPAFDEVPVVQPALPRPRPTLRFAGWLLLAWLTVAVALLTGLARRSRRVASSTKEVIPAPEPPEQLLEVCCGQMQIARRIRLRLSTTVSSPAVYGFLRPVILIPQRLADKLSALQLRAVLLHELAHIRRGDVLVHYAQTLLQILYWWHPLLWLANARIRRVREQAVDEMVMVEMGGDAEVYPATLLEVAKLSFQRPMLALGLIGIVESESALSQRIKHLIERPVPKSARLGFTGLAVVVLAGALVLPMARAQRRPNGDAKGLATQPTDQVASIDFEVEFISTAGAGPGNLSLGQPTVAGPNGHLVWVLSSNQREDLLRRIERESVVVSAPTLTTSSGREATVDISGVEPFKHPQARTTAGCHITPHLNGRWIDLSIAARITESDNVDSVLANDPKAGQNLEPGADASGQVFGVVHAGSASYDVGTAQISVGDGETVLLQNPALMGADGKRILVLVSPRVIQQPTTGTVPGEGRVSIASASVQSALSPRTDLQASPSVNLIARPFAPSPSNAVHNPSTIGEIRKQDDNLQAARERLAELLGRYEAAHPKFRERREHSRKLETEQTANNITPSEWIVDVVGNDHTPLPGLPQGLPTDVFLDYLPVGLGGLQRAFSGISDVTVQREGTNFFVGGPVKGNGQKPYLSEITVLKAIQSRQMLDHHFLIRVGPEASSELILKTLDVVENAGLQRFDIVIGEDTLADFAATIMQRKAVPIFGGDMPVLGRLFIDGHVQKKLAPDKNSRSTASPSQEAEANTNRLGAMTGSEGREAKLKFGSPPGHEIEIESDVAADSSAWAQTYGSEGFRLRLNTDGTYLAAVEEDGVRRSEAGMWKRKGREFILERKTGDLQYAIRQLRVDERNPSHLLWIPDVSIPFGAIDYFVFKPTDETLERRNGTKQTATAKPRSENPSAVLETRIYKLDLYVLRRNLQKPTDGYSVGDSTRPLSDLVREFFRAHKISLAAPKTMFLNEQTGALLVRTTAEELERIGPVVTTLNTGKVEDDPGVIPPINEGTAAKRNRPEANATLETRIFRLNSNAFLEALQTRATGSGASQTITSAAESLRDFLTDAGVRVTPPNMMFFSHGTGMLMIRASAKEIDLAQKALEVLNVALPQITLEARFMELPTDAAREFGFDLSSPREDSNAWARVLTAAQTREVLHAAEQRHGVDILTAPKVTTLSGRQTQIQVTELKTIVDGINPEALTPPGVRSTNRVPAQPYITSPLPVGTTLDVISHVAADGYTIHLTAMPQVTEFLRYDDPPNGPKKTRVWVDGRKQFARLPMPIFRTRQMQASVDVYDGQTLVLANPQITVISKLPTGESVTNAIPEDPGNRLLVFITPTIIDPAGNPIHTPGKEPWADKMPPQSTR